MFTLNEALEAIQGHDEFAIKVYNDVVCLDYIVCLPNTFVCTEDEIRDRAYDLWDKAGQPASDGVEFWLRAEKDCKKFAWYRRNFRGVTFNEKTGEVLSLPLHKFFNVNQTAETQFNLLESCEAKIYEKADGSMIHFFIHPCNELRAATCRSTETPQAQDALSLAKNNPVVLNRIHAIIADGWTPIFEFVAPHNQIVVRYPRPRLVYLISRSRKTGEYRFHDGFPDTAKSFTFLFKDVGSHLDLEEFEGYVCHLDNGMIVKWKTPWYMERHRAVDALMRPAYKLYQVVFDGIMDDLLPIAPDWCKAKLTSIYEEAERDLLNEEIRVEKLFRECLEKVRASYDIGLLARKNNRVLRKDFALFAQNNYKADFSLLMILYVGNDPAAFIKDRLMEGYKIKYPNKLYADLVEGDA